MQTFQNIAVEKHKAYVNSRFICRTRNIFIYKFRNLFACKITKSFMVVLMKLKTAVFA